MQTLISILFHTSLSFLMIGPDVTTQNISWNISSGTQLATGEVLTESQKIIVYKKEKIEWLDAKGTTKYALTIQNSKGSLRSDGLGEIIYKVVGEEVRGNITIKKTSAQSSLNYLKRAETTNYFDGLGRPMQSLTTQGSPSATDMVQPIVYDESGREAIKYLPYASTDATGWYKANAVGTSQQPYTSSPQYTFYENGTAKKIARDTIPFTVTVFEASPLSRVMKQGSPGARWQPSPTNDHSIKKSYVFNTSSDHVYLFNYTASSEVVSAGYYDANTLYANTTTDEEDHLVIEFIDMEGKTVCKKVQSNMPEDSLAFASTYYIYDDLGNLVVVLPPEGVEKLETALNLN